MSASGQKNGLRETSIPVPSAAVDRVRSHLHQRRPNSHAGDHLARHRPGGDTRCGLTRRRAAAAAIVAQAVFGIIGVIGVAGAIEVADLRIVLGALVDILDDERDRRAGRHLFADAFVGEDAGEDLHLVGLAALSREARLAGTAAVELALNLRFGERQSRRSAVDHAAERGTMALAEGGDPKQMAEAVVRHGFGALSLSLARVRTAVKPSVTLFCHLSAQALANGAKSALMNEHSYECSLST